MHKTMPDGPGILSYISQRMGGCWAVNGQSFQQEISLWPGRVPRPPRKKSLRPTHEITKAIAPKGVKPGVESKLAAHFERQGVDGMTERRLRYAYGEEWRNHVSD